MAQAGDTYTVILKEAHLDWGEYRNPTNREPVSGEGYIPIPKKYAVKYNIFNSNSLKTGLGYNLFYASSVDGYLQNVELLAQGCSEAGDIYAKQFSVKNDLKAIGQWYRSCGATTSNSIKVTWISPNKILLEIL